MVIPATQTNKVITYLITDAVGEFEQDLDEAEDIKVKLINFDQMENLVQQNKIRTQLFTVHAYFMARAFLDKQA